MTLRSTSVNLGNPGAIGGTTPGEITGTTITANTKFVATTGTVTADTPTYSATQTWNNGAVTFTGFKVNVTDTASATASLLFDWQVGGATKCQLTKAGALQRMPRVYAGDATVGTIGVLDSTLNLVTAGFLRGFGSGIDGMGLSSTGVLSWEQAGASVGAGLHDLVLLREAANTLAQRNGAAAQQFRLYKTFTDSGNHQRLFFDFNGTSSAARLATTWSGTGTAFNLELGGGTGQWRFDTDGNLRGFTATGGLGYTTGAGGSVTQLTSKSTGVTSNTVTGIITMNAASLAADTTVSFVLTDSAIAATDAIFIIHESGGTLGAYGFASTAAAGSVSIAVRNNTPGALAEAIVLRFVVFKSVNT